MKDHYESPLGSRYASEYMLRLFSSDMRILTWRRLWVALARAEQELGLPVTKEQVEQLEAHGYRQYEISNFARPGQEGRHNLIYWDCRDYLGLGPAAASCMEGRRFSFGRSTREFLAGAAPAEEGECTGADYIMLRLRLAEGLRLSLLRERYGLAFDEGRLAFIRRCVAAGYALFDGDRLALTPKGMLVQNSILTELLP